MKLFSFVAGAAAGIAIVTLMRKRAPEGNAVVTVTLGPGEQPDVTMLPGDTIEVSVPGAITSIGQGGILPQSRVELPGLGDYTITWTELPSLAQQTSTLSVVAGS